MSKLRIAMLVLVILGLGVEFYIAGKLATTRARVADQLRKAIDGSEKAIAANDKARQDQLEARQNANLASIGWGPSLLIDAQNAGNIQVAAGRIAVNGLGRTTGLIPANSKDAAGQNQDVPPVVHVFALDQGNSYYIGEFVAELATLTDTGCVLTPRWNPSPNEMAGWQFAGGGRFRTQIPAAGRSRVENFRQIMQRSYEQIVQTNLRIQDQQRLNAQATEALETRKRELLGDPDAPVNADHPEYQVGLVQALEDLEEERNGVQIAVDQLRRLIKSALESRQLLMDSLKQLAARESTATSRLSQRPE